MLHRLYRYTGTLHYTTDLTWENLALDKELSSLSPVPSLPNVGPALCPRPPVPGKAERPICDSKATNHGGGTILYSTLEVNAKWLSVPLDGWGKEGEKGSYTTTRERRACL